MGEDTEQLRREIEETRADITRDVDALTYKASPKRMVGDKVEDARSGLTGLKDKVFGSGSDAAESASDRATAAKDRAGSALSSAQESAGSAASTVSGAVSDAPSKARQQTQGNPLAAGVIAFGVGWLVSTLIPASQKETEVAQKATDAAKEHKDTVLGEAKQAASDVGQALKEPAQQAVESVKSTAAEGAQQVKDQGTSSAQSVKETAQSGDSGSTGSTSYSPGSTSSSGADFDDVLATPTTTTYPSSTTGRGSDPAI